MNNQDKKVVIFTDLDGTLLDREDYSCEKAHGAIQHLLKRAIPVVFCSAKTRVEQEVYRSALGISDPFIVENGGAIFIRQGYFPFDFDYNNSEDGYQVIELGIPYGEIRAVLKQVSRERNFDIRGFGDMSAGEVASLTGLDLEAASRAKQREYDETLTMEGTPEEIEGALQAIAEKGLKCTSGGRYYDVMGGNDKGKATRILTGLFRRKFGELLTIAIGDSPNDLPMLSEVEWPFLVQQPGGTWEELDLPRLQRVNAIGPEGWSKVIENIGVGY